MKTAVWLWMPAVGSQFGLNAISMGMALRAVLGEPVSASKFPVNRENTGKFGGSCTIQELKNLAVAATFPLFGPIYP